MAIKIVTLAGNDTLQNLQKAIVQTEQIGFELITLSRGVVNNQRSNTATFRDLAPGAAAGQLTLIEVPGSNSLPNQEVAVNAGEVGGKQLICYAAVLVQGNETNIVGYRE